jgi:hypothetical protein
MLTAVTARQTGGRHTGTCCRTNPDDSGRENMTIFCRVR